MKALSALATIAFLAACAGVAPSVQQTHCVVELRMRDDAERQRLLEQRRETIVRAVARGDVLIAPTDAGLLIVTRDAQCVQGRWSGRLGLDGASYEVRETVESFEHANALMMALQTLPRTHAVQRQCVVRFRERDDWQFGRLLQVLGFTGLRGVQVESANGQIYIAADDPCPLLRAMTTEAHVRDARVTPARLEVCPQSSLAACGFPVLILAPIE